LAGHAIQAAIAKVKNLFQGIIMWLPTILYFLVGWNWPWIGWWRRTRMWNARRRDWFCH
jgi:hypothetical protein